MSDDSQEPVSKTGEPKPGKKKAEDNPWYLLATLYGAPDEEDRELRNKNRAAWNRYFASNLDPEMRAKLIEEKRHPEEELTPFSPEDLQEVAKAFAQRGKASAKNPALPASDADIDFSYVVFDQYALFTGYLFSRFSSFKSATFSDWADFDGATFADEVDFVGAAFSGGANFRGAAFSGRAAFSGGAHFDCADFSGGAHFDGATFSGEAHFGGATFSSPAHIDGTAFSEWARFSTFSYAAFFNGATVSGGANFDGATFSGGADFGGTMFSRYTDFGEAVFGGQSSFVNAEMKGETSFEGAMFKTEPPHFFGAKLHEGTVWRGIAWPKPKHKDAAGSFLDAYERLKLEMNRLQKHEDELDFFALEMQSRRVLLGTWSGVSIAIYGVFSDYGRSYLRPLVALFYLALIGTLAFLPFESLSPWQSLGFSAANTLNVFGFRKDFFEPAVIARLPAWLDVISALQTVLGTILLFLFGLGIRNKFRMK